MEVVVYDPRLHRRMLKQWLLGWELPLTMLDVLPPHGVIVPELATGFLYRTDSQVAIADGFVGNPAAATADRNQALDAVTVAIEELGRELGHRYIWAYSGRPEIVERARRHSWDIGAANQTFLSKTLF